MCKMVFIGTGRMLPELPFDKDHQSFHLERISGEFLTVADKFSTPNIYNVGTSEGCGCGFGIHIIDEDGHPDIADDAELSILYLKDTFRLIDLIVENTTTDNIVEMYCCWADDYSLPASDNEIIDISVTDFKRDFEIYEGMKTVFRRSA